MKIKIDKPFKAEGLLWKIKYLLVGGGWEPVDELLRADVEQLKAIDQRVKEIEEKLAQITEGSSFLIRIKELEQQLAAAQSKSKEADVLRVALHDIFELASRQKSNRDCAVDDGLIATAIAAVRVIRRVADERKAALERAGSAPREGQ